MIGLVIPRLSDPFYGAIADAVHTVAHQNEYLVVAATTNDDVEFERRQIQTMLGRGIDGMVHISSAGYYSGVRFEDLERIKIVAVDRPVSEAKTDLVVADNFAGARMAVAHLIGHGHSRIVCVSASESIFTLRERQEGYFKAMSAFRLRPLVVSNFAPQTSAAILHRLMTNAEAPTAIFCTNGPSSMEALSALASLSINVPNEVAIIGFDDFDAADKLAAPLSVIRQPISEMGRTAATRLFDQIHKRGKSLAPTVIKFPVELIVRRSCGCNFDRAGSIGDIRRAKDDPDLPPSEQNVTRL